MRNIDVVFHRKYFISVIASYLSISMYLFFCLFCSVPLYFLIPIPVSAIFPFPSYCPSFHPFLHLLSFTQDAPTRQTRTSLSLPAWKLHLPLPLLNRPPLCHHRLPRHPRKTLNTSSSYLMALTEPCFWSGIKVMDFILMGFIAQRLFVSIFQ